MKAHKNRKKMQNVIKTLGEKNPSRQLFKNK
jgi:hypothetical protein